MNWWQRLVHRAKLETQLDKELHFHIEQNAADLMERGMSSEEALRTARLSLGGPEQVKEECRDARGTRWIEDLWQDFRYALRVLGKKPAFTSVAVITLAIGIGASTAIFSAVNPILFEPLPYPQANRIMTIWDRAPEGSNIFLTFGTYREIAARSRSFESIAALKTWQPTMTGDADPERLEGQSVSAEYFRVLGIAPILGRDFDGADDRPRGPKTSMLSYGLWQRKFSGDRTIAGRQIQLDGDLYTVAGVMPRGFDNVLAPSAEVWTLLQYNPTVPLDGKEWGHHLRVIARLAPGAGIDQARRDLNAIARTVMPEFRRAPWAALRQGLTVTKLQEDVTGSVRPMLLAVLGSVLLVLAIACVNVMNLMLARGTQRRNEFAMRAALGARRLRLVRQLVTESVLLSALGGGLGMLVALNALGLLVSLSPPELPRAGAIGIDGYVFAFAFGVTALIGLIVGLVPALQAYDADLQVGLRQGSRGATSSNQWTRRTLVVAEVSLALVLLVGAGLLLHSLQRLFAVAPGFNSAHLLTMQVRTSGVRFHNDQASRRFFEQALEAVRRVPGVTQAAFTSLLPVSGDQFGAYGVRFEGNQREGGGNIPAFRYSVTPGYLETMGIPLRRGRFLDAHDNAEAPLAVLINESLAKRKFPGQDVVGQRLHAGPDNWPWATIAGVVADVKQTSLAVGQEDAFYMTAAQGWFADDAMSLVVRARGDVTALAPAIKRAIWSVHKDQAITRVITMDALVGRSAADRRFALIAFEAFAVVALALAAIGIYGVLSGSINERMREIGVRSALGASRGDIVALVVRQAMTLTGAGIVLGLLAAAAASRALVTLLFGVSRLDPVTYAGVIIVLAAIAAIACWAPAWRAARIDPAITLRAE